MTHKCSYRNCKNGRKKGLRMYKFPTYNTGLWVENSGNPDLVGMPLKLLTCRVLCEQHFRPQDMLPSGRLLKGSLPIAYSIPASEASKHQSHNLSEDLKSKSLKKYPAKTTPQKLSSSTSSATSSAKDNPTAPGDVEGGIQENIEDSKTKEGDKEEGEIEDASSSKTNLEGKQSNFRIDSSEPNQAMIDRINLDSDILINKTLIENPCFGSTKADFTEVVDVTSLFSVSTKNKSGNKNKMNLAQTSSKGEKLLPGKPSTSIDITDVNNVVFENSSTENNSQKEKLSNPLDTKKDSKKPISETIQILEKELENEKEMKSLKDVVIRLEIIANKLAYVPTLSDSYDKFGKYISSLLRGLPAKHSNALKHKMVSQVLDAFQEVMCEKASADLKIKNAGIQTNITSVESDDLPLKKNAEIQTNMTPAVPLLEVSETINTLPDHTENNTVAPSLSPDVPSQMSKSTNTTAYCKENSPNPSVPLVIPRNTLSSSYFKMIPSSIPVDIPTSKINSLDLEKLHMSPRESVDMTSRNTIPPSSFTLVPFIPVKIPSSNPSNLLRPISSCEPVRTISTSEDGTLLAVTLPKRISKPPTTKVQQGIKRKNTIPAPVVKKMTTDNSNPESGKNKESHSSEEGSAVAPDVSKPDFLQELSNKGMTTDNSNPESGKNNESHSSEEGSAVAPDSSKPDFLQKLSNKGDETSAVPSPTPASDNTYDNNTVEGEPSRPNSSCSMDQTSAVPTPIPASDNTYDYKTVVAGPSTSSCFMSVPEDEYGIDIEEGKELLEIKQDKDELFEAVYLKEVKEEVLDLEDTQEDFDLESGPYPDDIDPKVEPNDVFICNICQALFRTEPDILEHFKQDHPGCVPNRDRTQDKLHS